MKPITIVFTFFMFSVVACTSEQKNKQIDDTAKMSNVDTTFSNSKPGTNGSNCYVYIKNRDTASLKITMQGEELTGELDYKLFEKDSNKGKIAGELKGDTIIAEYTFDSEGIRSVREVIFVKKADGKIYEGTGEMMEKGSKMVFKNPSALKFDQTFVFTPSNCK